MRCFSLFAVSTLVAGFIACSDDDGSNIVPNGPPGSGGSGATGGTSPAGAGGVGGSGTGGIAGTGGGGTGGGGGGTGGSGGEACIPVSPVDAGTLDAGTSDAGLDASTESPPLGFVSFERDVHPIFAASCGPCHVTDGSAGHNVGGTEIESAYEEAVGIGQRLVTRVDGGGMPPSYAEPPNDCGGEDRGDQPGDPGCLTVAEVQLIQTWINQCYPR